MNWDTAPADLEALRAQAVEYRGTIAQQAELLAAHKSEMQDWQRELLAAQQQVAALTKERDAYRAMLPTMDLANLMEQAKNQLAASQARDQQLREMWEKVEAEYFSRLKEQDALTVTFEDEKEMYGWNFHKGLRGGLVEFHIYMTKIAKALALPTDDTALQERLQQERERVAQMILNGSFLHTEAPVAIWAKEVAAAIRSMT